MVVSNAFTTTEGNPFAARLNATEYLGETVLGAELNNIVAYFSIIINKAAFSSIQSVLLSAINTDQIEDALKIRLPGGATINLGPVNLGDDYNNQAELFYYLNLGIVQTGQPPPGINPLELDVSSIVAGLSPSNLPVFASSGATVSVSVVEPLGKYATSK